MIIFHIEDNASEIQACIMDLLQQKGYSCSVSRVGHNSVVCATVDCPAAPSEPSPEVAPEATPEIAADDSLGSFEITDFGAQAIEIGKGMSAGDADTLTVSDIPPVAHSTPRACGSKLIVNELSTLNGINCVYDDTYPISTLYVYGIDAHEFDPNQVLVTVKTEDFERRVSMFMNEYIISQCSNEEALRNRECDGPVVKLSSPLCDKPFGVVLRKLAPVDIADGATTFCCIGKDLSFLVDRLREKGEGHSNGEVSAQ